MIFQSFQRLAVVARSAHPIEGPLAASTRCAQEHGVELVRLVDGAEARACDLVVALGGDG